MLEEHFENDNIFDQPVFEAAKLFDENSERNFGKYKIIREIGAGGTGTVFLAERDDGEFEQKVAVKVARQIVADTHTVKRFMFERQILASLNHPFIAKLYDGGISEKGSPFLIMEYIEAASITDFADEHNLSIKERLKLFVKVCEGVTFAHRNLIVHRDIKPSNILVTKNGTPKLLDFGLAKLLETDLGETSTKTATIFQALTPAYASPEQIQGKPITTATDIYSLGIILYELLTGNRPYSFANKNLSDILQTLENSRIAPPSEAKISECVNKETNPKLLKGDLDTIILKALRCEPEQRYGSVEKFADDIGRHLNGLPITARPVTFFYQASKFYQRNKVVVLAGIFVFLALIAGIAAAVSQANAAREQANVALEMQRRSEIETEHARAEEEKAKKITAYVSKVFSYANPHWYAEGAKFKGETKVIEAMDELSDKIDTEFAGQADIQAELHHKFAEIYTANGKGERSEQYKTKALEHIRRALELRRQFYGERHELVAKDMVYLIWCGGVEPKDHATYLMAAINMMRETNPNNLNLPFMLESYTSRLMLPDSSETHEQYRNAVLPLTDENKYQIAERYLREMLTVFRLHYKEDNQVIFATECRLAYTLAVQEKWTDFDEHFAVCKQSEGKVSDAAAKALKKYVELVEKALTDKHSH